MVEAPPREKAWHAVMIEWLDPDLFAEMDASKPELPGVGSSRWRLAEKERGENASGRCSRSPSSAIDPASADHGPAAFDNLSFTKRSWSPRPSVESARGAGGFKPFRPANTESGIGRRFTPTK